MPSSEKVCSEGSRARPPARARSLGLHSAVTVGPHSAVGAQCDGCLLAVVRRSYGRLASCDVTVVAVSPPSFFIPAAAAAAAFLNMA